MQEFEIRYCCEKGRPLLPVKLIMFLPLPPLLLRALPCALLLAAGAPALAGEIYTCVDARGNRLTSDRPIAACLDREQRMLNKSGSLKQMLPPSYTGEERAAIEARKKQEQAQREQQEAQARTVRVLQQRYPTQATLETARASAAQDILALVKDGYRQLGNLQQEQVKLNQEMEFYKKNPLSAPLRLRTQIEANAQSQKTAQKFIDQQRSALVTMHQRFDEEAATLAAYWGNTKP